MTISELKSECKQLIINMYWAGDVNYSPFEREYLDSINKIDEIFDKFEEENKWKKRKQL